MKKKIEEQLEQIQSHVEYLTEIVSSLINNFTDISLITKFDKDVKEAAITFKNAKEEAKKNTDRANLMVNELKGVVSMARATLQEGKKFSELLELPRILNAFSIDYQDFRERNAIMNDQLYKNKTLTDKLEEMIFLVSRYNLSPEQNKPLEDPKN